MAPFLLLCFFNRMASDDYSLSASYRVYGFWKGQELMFAGFTGRFFTTFLTGAFMDTGIMTRYYFLHPLLFFILTGWAIFFLVSTVHKNILAGSLSRSSLALISALLFLLNLYTLADIATGYYWFCSVVVYQTAFILSLLLAGCLLRRFYPSGSGSPRRLDILILLLLVLISGSNEVAPLFFLLLLSLLAALHYYLQRKVPRALILYIVALIVLGLFLVLSSGIVSVRSQVMSAHPRYLSILPILLFRIAGVLYYILKEPLFWVAAFLFFLAGVRSAANPRAAAFLSFFRGRSLFLPGLSMILLLLTASLAILLVFTNGSLPPRALNNLIGYTLFCLLGLVFMTGLARPSLALRPDGFSSSLLTAILVCVLLASVNYQDAWKSVLSGYFYHSVMEDREKVLLEAEKDHRRTAVVEPFEQALQEKIRRVFPNGTFKTLNKQLQEKPTTILYYNPAEEKPIPAGYLAYYQLDTILIRKDSAETRPGKGF